MVGRRQRTIAWNARRSGSSVPILALVAVGLFTSVGISPLDAHAAEIRLHSECRGENPVIALGDIATIHARDQETVDSLASLELFPAPTPGSQRFVSVNQIQDMLFRRGVNLAEHRLSGSSRVTVLGPENEAGTEKPDAPSTAVSNRATDAVSQAVARYLSENASATQPWIVNLKLDEQQVRLATAVRSSISVRGGVAPWTGPQRFEITVDSAGEPATFQVDSEVSLPPNVVVAARALSRGKVILPADVRLQPVSATDGSSERFFSLDEVIGLEVSSAIAAGRPLSRKAVRQPLLVRRGDVVTVFSRAAGISVRVIARARDDGSLGDAVAVESMLDRKVYYARVSGLRQADVFAQPVRTKPAAPAKTAGANTNWTDGLGKKRL